ncbi:MAG TPA: KH domain-containing protein [Candidatus Paceibacterota bacterium]
MQDADKVFLEYVVKALVDNPDDVKIDRTVDEMGVLISLTVNPADMGKIIGRMGNTAKAIRTLLRIIGMKNNARVNLKINEPEGGTGGGMGGHGGGAEDRDDGTYTHRPTPSTPNMKTVDEAMEDLKGI